MTECDCPFCPLVKANVQTCDVLVKVDDDGENLSLGGITCTPDLVALRRHFFVISVVARNNHKLPRGYSIDFGLENKYSCNVFRQTNDTYKICFHNLNVEEDPVAMD